MDFMAVLFIVLFISYVGVNIWDEWDGRTRNLFSADGRFLRHQYLRGLITTPPEPMMLSPDARFAVKHAGTVHRCEVCHQPDCFDVGTGFCQRCDHRTL